ncbi:hypothetical protein, partial [Actinophytocola sp.]|uniref:hypothetical protein n=1 Tax=Actinophytocola sp. TaxID=1872138 RepID=UPI002D664054
MTSTGESRSLSMRAQAVLASGLVRIGQHVGAVQPGFDALALAESGGALVLAAELRLDLAECAQELGEPLLGGALLRPVLEATHAPPSMRAAALGRLVGCLAHVARRDDIEDALAEADRLLAADDGLDSDARRMERARLAVRSSAYHRWYGDNEEAVNAARDGLGVLKRLHRELRPESDRLRARLVLELVCALLDEGELYEAEEAAKPTVDEPVRATSAESVGQLMLALATRVHLPSGEVDRGRGLVDQAAWLAERHNLDSLLADALTELSRLDEQAGRTKEALEAMRSARAAEQRRMRAVARAARHLLVQVGAGQGMRDVSQQSVAALLRQLAHPAGVPVAMAPSPAAAQSTLPPPRTSTEPHERPSSDEVPDSVDERTGLLNREGLVKRLRSVRKGERPVALTLVRFEPLNDNRAGRGPDTGIMVGLADKVRGMAPENAELARSDGGELAVFLPHTTRDQAEEFAASIRETATKSDMSISTSVVQSDSPTPGTETQDAAGMLTAARDALTPTKPPPTSPSQDSQPLSSPRSSPTGQDFLAATEPSHSHPAPASALTDEPPTTPLTQAPATDQPTGGRSILNSLSIPSGSGGRRRAGGEPAPGEQPQGPTESAEGPRLTRAERRAQEQANPADTSTLSSSGWPAEPDISQVLHRTPSATRRPTNPTPAAASATDPGSVTAPSSVTDFASATDPASGPNPLSGPNPASGFDLSSGPNPAGGFDLSSGPNPAGGPDLSSGPNPGSGSDLAGGPVPPPPARPEEELPRETGTPIADAERPAPTYSSTPKATTYEETRAELARMMSTLNAKALRARNKADAKPEDAPNRDLDAPNRDLTAPEPTQPTSTGHHAPAPPSDLPSYTDFAHGASAPRPGDHAEDLISSARLEPRQPAWLDFADGLATGGHIEAGAVANRFEMGQTISSPPEPDDVPEPPGRPDIPEPPRRPDIPEPFEP